MNSDYGYVAPHIKMSEELSSHGVRVWLYDFTYQSRNAIYPEWMGKYISEHARIQKGLSEGVQI